MFNSMYIFGTMFIAIFIFLIYALVFMKKINKSFNFRVVAALLLGIIFGSVLQIFFGSTNKAVLFANSWISVVGGAYVRLLNMIVIPLIFISILTAIVRQDSKGLGKKAGRVIFILLFTTAIAAFLGAIVTAIFNLSASSIQKGAQETQRAAQMLKTLENMSSKTIQSQLIEIIPKNPFAAMAGMGSNATLAVVVFSTLIGISALQLRKINQDSAEKFKSFVLMLHDVVMRLVQIILRLTPYGVLALMTKVVSTSNIKEILKLVNFVVANYLAILLMFVVHGIIILLIGLNPIKFFKKSAPTLLFAFSSRSSAGTLPLTVSNQIENLGVDEGISNLSSSLGVSIGQNGCAGIYPAMLAAMIAPTLGINPFGILFLLKLVIITAFASFGIAGVGGGATFAAITVLSAMGFPVELAGLLVAIEPLIDMARTALNVSGATVAGVVTAKSLNTINEETYNK